MPFVSCAVQLQRALTVLWHERVALAASAQGVAVDAGHVAQAPLRVPIYVAFTEAAEKEVHDNIQDAFASNTTGNNPGLAAVAGTCAPIMFIMHVYASAAWIAQLPVP